jgi:tetratricopeptide (TPR) repeat protein
LRKSIEAYKNYYGESHLTTAFAIVGMAEYYLRQGNLKLAEESFKRALGIFRKTKHPDAYICLESLADLCLEKAKQYLRQKMENPAMGDKKQAISYLQDTLITLENHFPKNSPHIQRVKAKLNQLTSNT